MRRKLKLFLLITLIFVIISIVTLSMLYLGKKNISMYIVISPIVYGITGIFIGVLAVNVKIYCNNEEYRTSEMESLIYG